VVNLLKFSISAVLLLLISCSGSDPVENIDLSLVRNANATLEQGYAELRADQINDVNYILSIDLSNEDSFTGVVEIDFNLSRADMPLTIDFNDGEVIQVLLNDQAVPFTYNDWFITISPDDLVAGPISLTIDYSHSYSDTGAGLYRFTDPEDHRVYLYTDFEPYDANRLFPSFDQPDLKATYTLDVVVPHSWRVISSVRESSVQDEGEVSHWYFPKSQPFSTYIFPLHAGEYAVWESTAEDIPLRLFARQSLAEHVVPEDWFSFTQHGFKFYQDLLAVPYSYLKYDQLIVPHFNAGAMENTAAVTFSERYIQRGSYTQENLDRINSVIQHEMAHMWFGNLVTMRWWNGLWLNESLATYMSFLSEAQYPNNDRAWLSYYLRRKTSAYATDERVTTHAIELPVADSDSAFANFDAITYGKGAALLKQLSYLLGEENFNTGITSYLTTLAEQNSELDDLISSLATASNRDLNDWTQQWFYTKGPNTIAVDYQCENQVVSDMTLTQSAPVTAPTLREHQLAIGLFSGGALIDQESIRVTGETQQVEDLLGKPCPDFVLPNLGDWAYSKVQLSDKDHAQIGQTLHDFDDPLVRGMLWQLMWESVRDLRSPINDYGDTLLENVVEEKNPRVLLAVLDRLGSVISYYYMFDDSYAEQRNAFIQKFENIAWAQVLESDAGSDIQKSWFDNLVSNTQTESGLIRLANLLTDNTAANGLEIDQDRRWTLITYLSAHNFTASAQLIEEESMLDPSDRGAKAALGARVAMATMEQKSTFLAESQNMESGRELAERNQITGNLFYRHQTDLQKALLADVLGAIQSIDQQADQQQLRSYLRGVVHGYCEPESVALLEQTLASNESASLNTIKALRVAIQEDQRCIDIKAKAGLL
jgi:aminopeptidase N